MSKKNPSWGGRFSKTPSQIAQNFSSSVDVDQALYSQDIQGSIAYAEALMEAKVLSKNEFNKIKTGLKKILTISLLELNPLALRYCNINMIMVRYSIFLNILLFDL